MRCIGASLWSAALRRCRCCAALALLCTVVIVLTHSRFGSLCFVARRVTKRALVLSILILDRHGPSRGKLLDHERRSVMHPGTSWALPRAEIHIVSVSVAGAPKYRTTRCLPTDCDRSKGLKVFDRLSEGLCHPRRNSTPRQSLSYLLRVFRR